MCSAGYIASRTKVAKDVSEFFATLEEIMDIPRQTIRPTNQSPIVRLEDDGQRHMRYMHWGLIPFWAKDGKFGHATFNARSESVAEKPTFREPFRKRRGIMPWLSYVEWREEEGKNIPYELSLRSGTPLALAGLWDSWTDGTNLIESCTVVTTSPNELASAYQDRMPVILHEEDFDLWLSPNSDLNDLTALMSPFPSDLMQVTLANQDDFRRPKKLVAQGSLEF